MIDAFLDDLAKHLMLSARARDRVVGEVRDHLNDAAEALEIQGVEPGVARERAIRAFGPAADIAHQLNAQAATAAMRRTPFFMAASATTVLCGFLLAAITQPQPAVPPTAGMTVRIAFFAAGVGLQIAVVAGARAVSLVAARGRVTTAVRADREQVRDAAVIGVGGLVVATLGWTLALVLAIANRPYARMTTLVTGIALMAIGALLAAASAHRPTLTDIDDSMDLPARSSRSVLGLGERLIQVVRRWPSSVCGVVAGVGALVAMSGAETTVTGAIPSGIFEASAIVAGFVLLGPRLGLRVRREYAA
jgi:hypothetical protein